MTLDISLTEFRKALDQASEMIISLYSDLENKKVFDNPDLLELRNRFKEKLPVQSQPLSNSLNEIQASLFNNSTLNISPKFFASIIGGGSQAGIVGELLNVAINQNCSLWHRGPVAAEVENRVIQWLSEFIGYKSNCGGILTSGGTMASLIGLAVARKVKADDDISSNGYYDSKPMTLYTSIEAHTCIDKVVDLLGFGKKYLRKIPTFADHTIDTLQLSQAIRTDKEKGFQPLAVIATAGTGNTGAVDPLESIHSICEANDLWFHVDAAYGGAAAKVKDVEHLFSGLENADSVAIDPQKWLHVPFEAGCVLVKNSILLKETFSHLPHYLQTGLKGEDDINYMEFGPQLTRSFRALKVWLIFKTYGANKLRESIETNIDNIKHLAELIEQSHNFELLARGPLSIVCFRYRPKAWRKYSDLNEVNKLNRAILNKHAEEGKYFFASTVINEQFALRVANVNHRSNKTHLESLLKYIDELGQTLLS